MATEPSAPKTDIDRVDDGLPETSGASTGAGRKVKSSGKKKAKKKPGDYALIALVALLSFLAVLFLLGAAQQLGLEIFGSGGHNDDGFDIPWVELGVGLLAAGGVWALIRRG